MTKNVLLKVCIVILLSACASTSKNSASKEQENRHETITSIFDDVDTSHFVQHELIGVQNPKPLMDLPATEDGGFVLSKGFYEADFKSYCLQPGTPDPRSGDAYFRAPLTGQRKEIIQAILRNSQRKPYLDQRNVQLLLWSVVSKSNFDNLSSPVQSTARELLTSKQIYELRGGTMGVVKQVVKYSGITGANNDIARLFEIGNSSYEVYEQVAVLREPATYSRPDFKRDQWYKTQDGYYVRYFPSGYKNVKIQVYVPDNAIDSSKIAAGHYLVFDPTSMVIVPAYSNTQRLGIGAPVVDIIRQVIKIEKNLPPPPPRKMPQETPKTTKPQQ